MINKIMKYANRQVPYPISGNVYTPVIDYSSYDCERLQNELLYNNDIVPENADQETREENK